MFDMDFVLTQDLVQVGHVVLLIRPRESIAGLLNLIIQLGGFNAAGLFPLPCLKHMDDGGG